MDGGGHSAAGGGVAQDNHRVALLSTPQPRGFDDKVSFGPTELAGPVPRVVARAGRSVGSWLRGYQILAGLIDAAAAGIAATIATMMWGFGPGTDSRAVGAAMPVAWVAAVAFNRGYDRRIVGAGAAEFDRIFRAFVHLTAVVAILSYATHAQVARGFVVVALPSALGLDLIGRYGARKWLHHQRVRGAATHTVLAVGDAAAVAAFTRVLARDGHAGMRVRGACVISENSPGARVELADAGVRLLGGFDNVVGAAKLIGADTVAVVSSSHVGSERLRWIAWQLEGTDIDLVVSPGLTEVTGRRLHIQPVAGLPLLHVDQPEFRGFRRLLKGSLDRVFAFLMLVLLLPILVAIYLLVRIGSRGPGFFVQRRVGRDGRTFMIVKFRTMFADAESRLTELSTANVYADGPLFKMRNDPRVTRVGRVLRRYSLDELPQLLNVLAGHMSLVGPRPPLPAEVEQYGDEVRRRLLVKPGVTGLWQVSGRNDLSWEESVQLDLRYVENWSPALDLMILWKTAFAVVRGSGSY